MPSEYACQSHSYPSTFFRLCALYLTCQGDKSIRRSECLAAPTTKFPTNAVSQGRRERKKKKIICINNDRAAANDSCSCRRVFEKRAGGTQNRRHRTAPPDLLECLGGVEIECTVSFPFFREYINTLCALRPLGPGGAERLILLSR